jgi:hypothetical protein
VAPKEGAWTPPQPVEGWNAAALTVSEGDTSALFVLKGHVTVNGLEAADADSCRSSDMVSSSAA